MSKLLDDYYSVNQLCAELDIKPRTLKNYRDQRAGPPVTYLSGQPHYRREAVRQWLRGREGAGRGLKRGVSA